MILSYFSKNNKTKFNIAINSIYETLYLFDDIKNNINIYVLSQKNQGYSYYSEAIMFNVYFILKL